MQKTIIDHWEYNINEKVSIMSQEVSYENTGRSDPFAFSYVSLPL